MLKVLLGLFFFLRICFKKIGIDRFMDLLKFKFQMLMGKGSTLIPGGMLPGMRMQMGFFFFPPLSYLPGCLVFPFRSQGRFVLQTDLSSVLIFVEKKAKRKPFPPLSAH